VAHMRERCGYLLQRPLPDMHHVAPEAIPIRLWVWLWFSDAKRHVRFRVGILVWLSDVKRHVRCWFWLRTRPVMALAPVGGWRTHVEVVPDESSRHC